MAKDQNIADINLDYATRYGFADPEEYLTRSPKGVDHETVEMISRLKQEPGWMRKFRHDALDIFFAKPMPKWGDTELLGAIDFADIYYYVATLSIDDFDGWNFVQFPIPRIDLLLAADNLALLYDVVRDKTQHIPALKQATEGEHELIEAIQPLPGGMQPVLAKDPASKRLFFATSRSFLTEYLDPAGALGASPAFARATRGFPVKANAISYLGPDLVGKVIDFAERASEAYPEVRPYVGLLSGLLPEPGIPMAAVQANLPGGIYSVSHNTMSHKGTLAMVLYANPIVAAFFLAGMVGAH